MKQQLVRGHIVGEYVFIDELLNAIICKHFFGRKSRFIKLWKTKRFQNFNYHILESLSLLRKLRLVREITSVDRKTIDRIEAINSTRNAIAHLFFPENKSDYRRKGHKVIYAGKDVFSPEGIALFENDTRAVIAALFPKAYGFTLEEEPEPEAAG